MLENFFSDVGSSFLRTIDKEYSSFGISFVQCFILEPSKLVSIETLLGKR